MPAFAVPVVLLLAALLALWTGDSYWTFSDGVYAYSAREVLEGRALYDDLLAAQPPPLYWLGAGVLALDDSLTALRVVLAAVAAVTAILVGIATSRLTGSRVMAAGAAVASLLVPWALKGHEAWVPESFAAPLLLGAALLAARPGRSVPAAVLAVAAGAFKLTYLVPATALALAARERGRYAAAAAVATALIGGAFLAAYGGGLIDNVVTAQRQSGTRSAGDVLRLLAEAGWNAGPLVALAAAAWLWRDVEDAPLRRTLTAAAAATTLTLVSVAKEGAYYNVLTVVEPLALPLAAAGLLWALRSGTAIRLAAAAAVAFMAAQSASILLSPEDPAPLPSPGGVRVMSDAEVDAAVAAARRCPPGQAYSQPYPFIAFLADRRMPGGQPDLFIVEAPVHAEVNATLGADGPRCP